MEADDEDTQDGDSLNHVKLDTNLTELTIKEDVSIITHENTSECPLEETTEVITLAVYIKI